MSITGISMYFHSLLSSRKEKGGDHLLKEGNMIWRVSHKTKGELKSLFFPAPLDLEMRGEEESKAGRGSEYLKEVSIYLKETESPLF